MCELKKCCATCLKIKAHRTALIKQLTEKGYSIEEAETILFKP